jgi:hypothetical protein
MNKEEKGNFWLIAAFVAAIVLMIVGLCIR